MKIAMVCPDLATNCVGRAHVLARVLQSEHTVTITGPVRSDRIWAPLENGDVTIAPLQVPADATVWTMARSLVAQVDADLVYVIKPLPESLIPAIWYKWKKGVPMILDIDDWEMGFLQTQMEGKRLRDRVHYYRHTFTKMFRGANGWSLRLCERLIRFADAVTVSNHFLQNRYGGQIIWHGRDPRVFDPDRVDGPAARRKMGVGDGETLILFLGTFRPHKGLDLLIAAVAGLGRHNAKLALVGHDGSPGAQAIAAQAAAALGEQATVLPMMPFKQIPQILAAADMVVIPQRDTPAARGQMPAKVFDAMAMGVPIIATDVNDLSIVLEDCGWVIPADDPGALQDAMACVMDHPEAARQKAVLARQRFLEQYSLEAIGKPLSRLIAGFQRAAKRSDPPDGSGCP